LADKSGKDKSKYWLNSIAIVKNEGTDSKREGFAAHFMSFSTKSSGWEARTRSSRMMSVKWPFWDRKLATGRWVWGKSIY